MTDLPFTMSAEATAWVERRLQLTQIEPTLFDLVPVLGYALDCMATDDTGKTILGSYQGGHFDIVWHCPEDMPATDVIELELVGFKVFAHRFTMDKLRGRHLEYKVVKCRTIPDFEFLVIKYERDVLKQAIRIKTLPRINAS